MAHAAIITTDGGWGLQIKRVDISGALLLGQPALTHTQALHVQCVCKQPNCTVAAVVELN